MLESVRRYLDLGGGGGVGTFLVHGPVPIGCLHVFSRRIFFLSFFPSFLKRGGMSLPCRVDECLFPPWRL
jgi:hypothetical protein